MWYTLVNDKGKLFVRIGPLRSHTVILLIEWRSRNSQLPDKNKNLFFRPKLKKGGAKTPYEE